MKNFYDEVLRICEISKFDREFNLKAIDSLSRAELIMAAEEHCGVQLTNAEIFSLDTLGDLDDLVRSKK